MTTLIYASLFTAGLLVGYLCGRRERASRPALKKLASEMRNNSAAFSGRISDWAARIERIAGP